MSFVDKEMISNEFGFSIEDLESLDRQMAVLIEARSKKEFLDDTRTLFQSLIAARKQLAKIKRLYPSFYESSCNLSGSDVEVDADIAHSIGIVEGKCLRNREWLTPTKVKGANTEGKLIDHLEHEYDKLTHHNLKSDKRMYLKMKAHSISSAMDRIQKRKVANHKETDLAQEFRLRAGFDIRQKKTLELIELASFWVERKGKIPTTQSHEFFRFAAIVLEGKKDSEDNGITIAERFYRTVKVSTYSCGFAEEKLINHQ